MKELHFLNGTIQIDDENPDIIHLNEAMLIDEQEAIEEHPGQYFCGICGWSDITTFPHDH